MVGGGWQQEKGRLFPPPPSREGADDKGDHEQHWQRPLKLVRRELFLFREGRSCLREGKEVTGG